MKTILVVALLLCAVPAFADTINCSPSDCTGPVTYTQLNGTVKSPGDKFTYDFFVESFTNYGQGEAILNGSILTIGKDAGLTVFYADYFFFPLNANAVLTQFGNWQLIATTHSAFVVDPPVATPEPSVLVLCLAGLLWALAFSARPVKQREYPSTHIFRKA